MFTLNKEMAFITWYVTEKEYGLTRAVRYALNMVHYFNVEKKKDLALAIDIVDKLIKTKEGVDLGKDYLWKMYRKRKAHVRNAKAAFRTYDINTRRFRGPNKEPLPVCECGCGTILKPGRRFVNGHNARCRSKEKNEKIARHMRISKKEKKSEKVITIF